MFTLGMIPHYAHKGSESIAKFVERYHDDVLLIDVMRTPSEVVSDVATCRCIASTSLHGVIVAHSLGIPAVLLELDALPLRGGRFKFYDYFSVFDIKPIFHKFSGNEGIDELCGKALAIDNRQFAPVKNAVYNSFVKFTEDMLR